jgi:hypothetical protein
LQRLRLHQTGEEKYAKHACIKLWLETGRLQRRRHWLLCRTDKTLCDSDAISGNFRLSRPFGQFLSDIWHDLAGPV